MMNISKRAGQWSFIGIALLYLSACSNTPTASDIPSGVDFSAKILVDDSKLFVYTQRFMRNGSIASGASEFSTMDSPRGMREIDGMRAMMPKASLRGLEAVLAQNNYCREGYMVLEQYEQHGSYIIRGECRDAATLSDREKFVR